MTLFDNYINGNHLATLEKLELDFNQEKLKNNSNQLELVLDELFSRVSKNFQVISQALIQARYKFQTNSKIHSKNVLSPPEDDYTELIKELKEHVKPFGFVPLSLQYFYKHIGSVNLAGELNSNSNKEWLQADPIKILPLSYLVDMVIDDDWVELMEEIKEDGEPCYLEISEDVHHKCGESGGEPYCIELTQKPQLDGLVLNEQNDTTFINYLRICIENGGFGDSDILTNNEFRSYISLLKTNLQKF